MLLSGLLCVLLLSVIDNPNSSTSMYSTLIDKVSSPKWCVSAWKRNYVDRSPVMETSQTGRVTTTQKTCVERWERPCGRPTTSGFSYTSSPSTTFRPLGRRRLISAIETINMTVQYITNNTMQQVYHRHQKPQKDRLDDLRKKTCEQLINDTAKPQMIDVVVEMIEIMQQVSAELSQLEKVLQADLYRQSVDCLCDLEEQLADKVDPQWRQNSGDWQSLPECTSPSATGTTLMATSTTAGASGQFVRLANNLIDVLEKLKVAHCIAEH